MFAILFCIEIDLQLPTEVSSSPFLLPQESGPDQSIHKQATNQISRDISSVLQLFAFQAHPRTWRLAFYVRRPPPLVCSGFLYLEVLWGASELVSTTGFPCNVFNYRGFYHARVQAHSAQRGGQQG
jgi:hypothetical protein